MVVGGRGRQRQAAHNQRMLPIVCLAGSGTRQRNGAGLDAARWRPVEHETRQRQQLLSVCLGLITLLYFHFYVLIGVLLKGVVKSCLLSKDELLTPNIDEDMTVWIFRRRAQNTKMAKIGLRIFSFQIYSRPAWTQSCSFFQGTVSKRCHPLKKIWSSTVHQLLRNNCAKFGTAHFPAKAGPMHFVLAVWGPKRHISGLMRLKSHTSRYCLFGVN